MRRDKNRTSKKEDGKVSGNGADQVDSASESELPPNGIAVVVEDEREEVAAEPSNQNPITEEAAFLVLEVDKLRRDIEEAKEKSKRDVDAANEARLRALAELDNVRRRTEREVESVRKYSVESLLREIVPVWDNLERAVGHAPAANDPVVQGVELVLKQFQEALAKFGVTPFHCLGELFDPARHQAIASIPSDKPGGTVLSEVATGFMIHERLFRPAMVVVSAAQPAPEVVPGAGADAGADAGAGAGAEAGAGAGAGADAGADAEAEAGAGAEADADKECGGEGLR